MSDLESTQRRRRSAPPKSYPRLLRVVHSPDPSAVGRTFSLEDEPQLIGRAVGGEGRIADNELSREHARVKPVGSGHVIEDLTTRNGTFLDGELITQPSLLADQSVVLVGQTLLVVDELHPASDLPLPPELDGARVGELVGISFAAQRLRRSVEAVAPARGSVLLLGPTGSGKEVLAKALHRLGPRADGPWVPVNCAAIPPEIAEAELFGHTKGAFTGAVGARDGYFAQACGGTLFLDEVGELPLPLQAKLLRVLEDGTIRPLGGGPMIKTDARVIAATHADVQASGFRIDLLARLGDWTIHLPPLRQRRSDILTLWAHFLERESPGALDKGLSADFAEALLLHEWPMNVRELAKLARRLAALHTEQAPFDLHLLAEPMRRAVADRVVPSLCEQPVEDGEGPGRAKLAELLRQHRGNVRKVAEEIGCHRTQTYRWLNKLGIDPDHYR